MTMDIFKMYKYITLYLFFLFFSTNSLSDDKVYCNDDAYSVMNNCYGSKIYAEGTYNGYWIDNKANGEGYWQGVEDYSYKGEFKDGLFHGQGEYSRNGITYLGEFKEDMFNGKGELFDKKNNISYIGEFKDDQYHGQGEYREIDITYFGEFKEGLFHGKGEFRDNDVYYVGLFKENLFDGKGELIDSDGIKYSGVWKKDFKNGFFIIEDPNGSISNSIYVNGDQIYDHHFITNLEHLNPLDKIIFKASEYYLSGNISLAINLIDKGFADHSLETLHKSSVKFLSAFSYFLCNWSYASEGINLTEKIINHFIKNKKEDFNYDLYIEFWNHLTVAYQVVDFDNALNIAKKTRELIKQNLLIKNYQHSQFSMDIIHINLKWLYQFEPNVDESFKIIEAAKKSIEFFSSKSQIFGIDLEEKEEWLMWWKAKELELMLPDLKKYETEVEKLVADLERNEFDHIVCVVNSILSDFYFDKKKLYKIDRTNGGGTSP